MHSKKRFSVYTSVCMSRLSLFLLTFLSVSHVFATTYYVSPSGNNGNSGSSTSPFLTIPYAYSKAIAGDTVIVKAGIYSDYRSGWGLHLDRSGTASAYITLRAEVNGEAIIDLQNKSDAEHGIYLTGSYNIIQGFKIRNAFLGGLAIYGSYNKFISNEIYNNGVTGNLTSSYGQDGVYSDSNVNGTLYQGNYIHHNGRASINTNLDHGFYLCGDNETVINNIVANNASYGLHIAGYKTVSNLKVYNNIFAMNGRSGGTLWQPVENVEIKNNIFYKNARYGLETFDSSGPGVVLENNIFYGNAVASPKVFVYPSGSLTITETNSIINNPLFVNDSGDFRVLSTSPAINAGVNLNLVTIDFFGTARPQGSAIDIGVYEYLLSAPAPSPSPTPAPAPSPIPPKKINTPKNLKVK